MQIQDFQPIYDNDERLSKLQAALETERGERKAAIKSAIKARKKKLREQHRRRD